MSFERPEGLWLLALALPILAFHFYRGKVRRLFVPTLLFWEQVLVEEERKSALRRLRHYVSLLLNVLALLVLTSAVAEPRVRASRKIALVVDTSPQMLARDTEGRVRLDRAREIARSWLEAADEAALYDGEGLREPLTRDREQVRRSIGELRIQPRGRPEEVARILRESRPDLEVVAVTDSSPVSNRGWVGGMCVWAPGESVPRIRLRAGRSGLELREERILVRWDGRMLEERTIRVEEPIEIPLDPARHPDRGLELGGAVEVVFAEPDDFPLDDAAFFIVPSIAPIPVLVFHPGNPDPFLMGALKALAASGRVGEVQPVAIEKYPEARSAIGEGTAVIFDRCSPLEPIPAGAILVLGSRDGGREIDRPVIVDWDRSDPLWEGIDLTSLAVRRSRILTAGTALIESAAGPIAVVERRGGFAGVVFGFSLEESDFALRAGFPLFLRNWTEWIRRGATRAFATQADFGDPIASDRLWIQDGELLARSVRSERRLEVRSGRFVDPFVPDWPGLYQFSAAERQEYVAVNAFGRARDESTVPEVSPPPPPPRPWYRKISFAVFAIAFVLLLLFAEGFLFHRGWI